MSSSKQWNLLADKDIRTFEQVQTLNTTLSFSHTKEHILPIVRINCYKIVMCWSTQQCFSLVFGCIV